LRQRHLQPLRHAGALHQHDFWLEGIVKPVMLDNKLHQCFKHIQTIGVVNP